MFGRVIRGRLGHQLPRPILSYQRCSLPWKRGHSNETVSKAGAVLEILKERGFVHQIAGNPEHIQDGDTKPGVYVGVDPTARSLHVGHLVPFMALFWMYLHGFRAFTVVGGATAQIGDPTWRTTARAQMVQRERTQNINCIESQLNSIWQNVETLGDKYGFEASKGRRKTLNNQTWLSSMSITEVLNQIGTGLRMGPLLSRDSVKSRLDSDDGMSLAEFCYPVLQAWDWLHMYRTIQVQIQIGGADQFGNIITGIEALKYSLKRHLPPVGQNIETVDKQMAPLMGFTVPLLTTSSGEKFGKSAGNAVWLDQGLTTAFDLYAYMLSTADNDVERLLKLFTFLPLSEISSVMADQNKDPSRRIAQHRLAFEFLCLAHGEVVAQETVDLHRSRAGQRKSISLSQLLSSSEGHDMKPEDIFTATLDELESWRLPDVLTKVGISETKSEGQRLVSSKGLYVVKESSDKAGILDWVQLSAENKNESAMKFVIWTEEQGILLLRAGKWKVKKLVLQK